MSLSAGNIIVSSRTNVDEEFGKKVILLVEVNQNGVIGFFLNKYFGRNLNELREFSTHKAITLFEGGPVDQAHLFFIHNQQHLGGDLIGDELYYSGNFKKALQEISIKENSNYKIKIFVGYCGWDLEQLENEIKEGDWIVNPSPSFDIFNYENQDSIWLSLVGK